MLLASTSTKVDCVKLKNQIHVIIRTCNIEKRPRYYKKLVRNYKKKSPYYNKNLYRSDRVADVENHTKMNKSLEFLLGVFNQRNISALRDKIKIIPF